MNPQTQAVEVHCAHDALVDTSALIANPRNPNTHPDKQIALLAKIITLQGWRVPITVSKRSGFIVRGHGRLMAAKAAGLEQCPVDYQDYDNEAAEWSDLIADNRLSELSIIDRPALKDLIEELDTGDFDLDLTGFDELDLKGLMSAVWEEEAMQAADQAMDALMTKPTFEKPLRDGDRIVQLAGPLTDEDVLELRTAYYGRGVQVAEVANA